MLSFNALGALGMAWLTFCVVRRVDKVKAWLSNCCSYLDVYEHRLRQRHPSSCAWFLGTEEYCKWKHAPFDQASANNTDELERSWHDRVLIVQGVQILFFFF